MYSSRPSIFCMPDSIAHDSSWGTLRGAISAVAIANREVVVVSFVNVAHFVVGCLLLERARGANDSTAADRRTMEAKAS